MVLKRLICPGVLTKEESVKSWRKTISSDVAGGEGKVSCSIIGQIGYFKNASLLDII